MTNIRQAFIALTLLSLLLAACGGDTASNPAASTSAHRFTVTGHIELTGDNITLLAYSTDEDFNRVEAGPMIHFIQPIQGPLDDLSSSVNLSLSPAVQPGTYELLDASLMSSDVYSVGYAARVDQRNSFYMLADPGTLTITQLDGGRISGSFEFVAYLAGSDSGDDRILVGGTFADVRLGA